MCSNINCSDWKYAIKISLSTLKCRSEYYLLFIIVIFFCIFCKGCMIFFELNIVNDVANNIKSDDTHMRYVQIVSLALFKIIICKITKHTAFYVANMLIEILITPVGSILIIKILKKLLFTDDTSVMSLSPSTVEYNLTEGTKASSIIIKMLFFSLFNIICEITPSLIIIKENFSENNTMFFMVYLLLVIFISFIQGIYSLRSFTILGQAHDINSRKEKIYSEVYDSLPVIKSYNEQDKMIRRYTRATVEWQKKILEYKTYKSTTVFIFNAASEVLKLVMFLNYTKYTYLNISTTLTKILLLYRCLDKINFMSKLLVDFYKDIGGYVVMAKKNNDYIKFKDENTQDKIKLDAFTNSIEIQNLSLYQKDKLIFRDINFVIEKGDKIALFGRNGTGKSSLFNILLGFSSYLGKVYVDGIDLQKLSLAQFRSLITYVPQNTKLFDSTIYYNLSYGHNKSMLEIVNECIKMNIHETIMGFAEGYNTIVGDNGKLLNGGLRQKIFYTRAFLCESQIFLFDEPTNNLDKENCKFLLDKINDPRFADKTFVVICHELEIVKSFPKVLYFSEGKIIAGMPNSKFLI